jgi:glycosyltransferase involved in cell wall biosynthesis
MKKFRITVLSPSEFPGTSGDTVNFTEIIDQFLVEGLRVLLICPKSNKTEMPNFKYNKESLEIVRIKCTPPRLNELKEGIKIKNYFHFVLFLLMETFTVLRLILTKDIKKVYVRHSILTMHLSILFKIFNIKTVADFSAEFITDSIKGLTSPIVIKIFSIYERKIIKYYNYLKVSTQSQKKDLQRIGLTEGNILIIPVSIRLDRIPKSNLEDIPENTFGYFGGLEPWQGIQILIKAFELLRNKIPSSVLYIIGDGSLMKELKEMVALRHLSSNVIFVGKIGREKLWYDYFNRFRIVIIPRQKLNNSIDTVLPIKLIESLAASKPVIAVDILAMREVQENPLLLVTSGNHKMLADAMFSLSTNLEEMHYRSELSYKSSKNYNIKENIKRLIEILAY